MGSSFHIKINLPFSEPIGHAHLCFFSLFRFIVAFVCALMAFSCSSPFGVRLLHTIEMTGNQTKTDFATKEQVFSACTLILISYLFRSFATVLLYFARHMFLQTHVSVTIET